MMASDPVDLMRVFTEDLERRGFPRGVFRDGYMLCTHGHVPNPIPLLPFSAAMDPNGREKG